MNSQVALPKAAADVTAPASGIVMHPAYAKAVGRFAYIWGWPMINMLNRSAAITKAPQPGRLNGVLPVAPRGQVGMLADYIDPDQTFVTCPNQDVVYGLGFFSLDEEPVVAQVPDFGERFWVYALYDARTDQFAEIGKPYKTKPGFYLLAGPNWKGNSPASIEAVIRSSTALANAIPARLHERHAGGPQGHPIGHQSDCVYPLQGLRREDEVEGLGAGAGDPRAEVRGRRRDEVGRARRSSSTSSARCSTR